MQDDTFKVFTVTWFALLMSAAAFLIGGQFGWNAAEKATPACETEDSNGCFWDAEESGNGLGVSFYADEDGNVYYMPNTKTSTEESNK